MPFVQRDGASLWYERRGAGGPPVLLIMGLAVPGAAWAPQIESLERDHRLVAFDNRGIGQSRASAGLYSMRQMAADAAAVMDGAGWGGAHVVGVSMGGMIAQELALQARDRVRSLTLIATHPGGVAGWMPPPSTLRLFAKTVVGTGAQRLDALAALLYPPEHTRGRQQLAAGGSFIPRAPRKILVSQLSAIFRHGTADRLSQLGGLPTLVVRPGQDRLVPPANSDRLGALIPGARVLRLDHAGHAVNEQCADELNQHIREHIRAAERATATA